MKKTMNENKNVRHATNDAIPSTARYVNLHFARGCLCGSVAGGSAVALTAGIATGAHGLVAVAAAVLCVGLGLTVLFLRSIDGPDTNRF